MSLPRCRPRSCARGNFSMPHDPELVAETRAWLAKASLDLAAADHELTAEPPFVEDIVFHAQQAVEKSFKALLT